MVFDLVILMMVDRLEPTLRQQKKFLEVDCAFRDVPTWTGVLAFVFINTRFLKCQK